MPASWNKDIRGVQVLPLINTDAETIRVEAGPGTRKTLGLVRRVERIMHPEGLGVSGESVLVVAFNRVIAKQLNAEIGKRLETFEHDGNPRIRTIHAMCVEVIGERLRLLLPHEREAMIYDLLELHPQLRELHEGFKKADQDLRDHEARHVEYVELFTAVQEWLTRHRAHLVSDLPGLLLDRLKSGDFEEQAYQHVIVDEFQDLTAGEQELMFRLRADGGQLTALGDPRQSIYKFRGNDSEGLAKLEALATEWGSGTVFDVQMAECQRCPKSIVLAANRLMSLSNAQALVAVSKIEANLHVVHWLDPQNEAIGMAEAVKANVEAHPDDTHLVMVTRREFGYWLRERVAQIAPDMRVELSFSESLLETWPVREAFLLFCLLADADPATWRAWLGYENSSDGRNWKATARNTGAYLKLLSSSKDNITESTIEQLVSEPRTKKRGNGGVRIWERAERFLKLREEFEYAGEHAEEFIRRVFNKDFWVTHEHKDAETARLDMDLLRDKAVNLIPPFVESEVGEEGDDAMKLLRKVAQRLRYQIATRDPFATDETPDIQVATLWGAKGVTAEHVYILGLCDEAIPGTRREEYPGTDAEYIDEQRRLFYVSLTRSKETLVLSRAQGVAGGEAMRLGLAADWSPWVTLTMSRFLRQIIKLLPDSVPGVEWHGCAPEVPA